MKKQIVTIEELVARSRERDHPTPRAHQTPSTHKKKPRAAWKNKERTCGWCKKSFLPNTYNQRYDTQICAKLANFEREGNPFLLRKKNYRERVGLFERTNDPSLIHDDPYERYEQLGIKDETQEILDQLQHGIVTAKHAGYEPNYTEIDMTFRRLEHAINKIPRWVYEESLRRERRKTSKKLDRLGAILRYAENEISVQLRMVAKRLSRRSSVG